MNKDHPPIQDELRPEYDLRSLRVRQLGPARKQFGNFIKLEPDIAAVFPDDAAVNKALRGLTQTSKKNSEARPFYLPGRVVDLVPKRSRNSVVKLEPDVFEAFPDYASVNKALRGLTQTSKKNSEAHPFHLPAKILNPVSIGFSTSTTTLAINF